MKKLGLFKFISAITLAAAGVLGIANIKETAQAKEAENADAAYNSTIRVYVDTSIIGGTINFVRIGTDQEYGNASLTSSNAKYNQSLGAYVRDISSSTSYTLMGCFWSENNQWSGVKWVSGGEDGYAPFDGGFLPGHEYQIKIGSWAYDNSKGKFFNYDVYHIGEITDNVSNATVWFLDGHSWHNNSGAKIYYWGGTASCASYPGNSLTNSPIRIAAYVGSSYYQGLYLYRYTISGSAAYVKFSHNGGDNTGDLRLVNNQIYYYGVDAGTFGNAIAFFRDVYQAMGSYTYGGKSFSKSICSISQSQAASFKTRYNDLLNNYGGGVTGTMVDSKIITYTSPETSTSTTGEVSFAEILRALEIKYPSLGSSSSRPLGFINAENNSSILLITIISLLSVSTIGGYFFLRRRKAQ